MNTTDVTMYVNRVSTLVDIKRFDEALKQTRLGLASYPDDYDLLYFATLIHLQQGCIEEADTLNAMMIRQEPENPYGYYLRSFILHERLSFDGELAMAEEAVRLSPEFPPFLVRLVDAQLQSGLTKKARKTAEQQVQLAPDDEVAHGQLASICMSINDFRQAEIHFRAALAIDADNIHHLANLSATLLQLKRCDEALDIIWSTVKSDPTNKELQVRLLSTLERAMPHRLFFIRRQRFIEKLPAQLATYYEDHRSRMSLTDKYHEYFLGLFWLIAGGGLTLFFKVMGV